MGVVRGILLDESVLVVDDDGGGGGDSPCFSPAAALLLRRLQYSNLRVGICLRGYSSPQKAMFLKRTAENYSFHYISLNASDSTVASLQAWRATEETHFYVTSREDELLTELPGAWKFVYVKIGTKSAYRQECLYIDKMEELPITICNFYKKVANDQPLLAIGYVMKQSREEDFAKRGAFPIHPTPNGLMFVPITLDHPLTTQLHEVDAILHKATDEIISFDPLASDTSEGILFSKGMHELERYAKNHPDFCLIDPLSSIYPLLDRLKIQDVLNGVENLSAQSCNRIRSPYFLKIDNFQQFSLKECLSEAKLSFPVIVKPQVACGVSDAHNMALVFKLEDFQDLPVPLPAIAQEFVDHGSSIFKFYVLGDKVFHAVKKSIPNADVLFSSIQASASSPVIFNSLKSLPVSKDDHRPADGQSTDKQCLDEELVNHAAYWLRRKLNLTIFGFDVVIQEGTGDHVIVDLNYLPSFKEILNADAIPAFWAAIRSTYERRKTTVTDQSS